MYAKEIDGIIRSAISAAGGIARDMPALDSPVLVRRLIDLDPSLTEERVKGLLTQYRDLASATSGQAEISDYVAKV